MLTNEQRQELRIKINDLIKKSEKDIIEIEKMTGPVKPDVSLGRISRMEAINNKSVMEAALRSKKKKLAQLKISLSKTDQPDFGICISCKQEIQSARMIFMPESNECIRCAGRR